MKTGRKPLELDHNEVCAAAQKHAYNHRAMARELGVSESTMYNYMKKTGMKTSGLNGTSSPVLAKTAGDPSEDIIEPPMNVDVFTMRKLYRESEINTRRYRHMLDDEEENSRRLRDENYDLQRKLDTIEEKHKLELE